MFFHHNFQFEAGKWPLEVGPGDLDAEEHVLDAIDLFAHALVCFAKKKCAQRFKKNSSESVCECDKNGRERNNKGVRDPAWLGERGREREQFFCPSSNSRTPQGTMLTLTPSL